jgi:hypothetical protein
VTEIYRSARFSCRSTHVTHDVLVVSVAVKVDPNLDAPGMLSKESLRNGYSALDILIKRPDRFPQEEVAGLLAATHSFTQAYRRVVVYGFSIGAYAAMNFAPFIGAKIAIAASPLFSPDPDKVPFERRWRKVRTRPPGSFPFDNMVRGLKSLDHAYVMYDPYDDDDQHTRLIAEVAPSVTLMPVPFSGHPVSSVLAVNGTIYRLIADIAHDRLDVKGFHAAARLCRRGSPRYFETLARLQPESRDGLRVQLLERGLLMQEAPRSDYLKQLIPPLIRLGRTSEAANFAELALAGGAKPGEIALLMNPQPEIIAGPETG